MSLLGLASPARSGSLLRLSRGAAVVTALIASYGLAVGCGSSDDAPAGPSDAAAPDAAGPGASADASPAAPRDAASDASLADARADAADAADGSGGWLPTELPHLALWLVGDTGLSPSSVWTDQSGNGNDVAPLPSAKATASSLPAAINGHGAIGFSADGPQIGDQSGLTVIVKNAPLTGDFLVLAVCQTLASGHTPIVLVTPSNSGTEIPINDPSTLSTRAYFGVNTPTFESGLLVAGMGLFVYPPAGYFADIRPHVIGMRRNAVGFALLDDQSETFDGNAPAGDVGDELVVGGPIHGFIAEVVLSAGATSDAEVAKLQAYFKNKYAIVF